MEQQSRKSRIGANLTPEQEEDAKNLFEIILFPMNAMKMREAIGGRKPTAEEKEAVSVVATIEAGMILAIEDEIGRHLSREELKDIVSRFAQLPFEDAFPMLGKTDRQEAWQA